MELSERAQKIADTHGHEWMAERIVELEDIRDAQILVTAFTQDDKEQLESSLAEAREEIERLRNRIDYVWNDIYENDSPTLSVASVEILRRLVQEDITEEVTLIEDVMSRIKERAERVLEGEKWDLASYVIETLAELDGEEIGVAS